MPIIKPDIKASYQVFDFIQAAQKAPYAVASRSKERVVLFMYVATTSDDDNAADGLFQQPSIPLSVSAEGGFCFYAINMALRI